MSDQLTKTSAKVTPLWIVAAFVTLTEAVLGYAVTQTTGGVQIALTVFVIGFALVVAGAFFLILWHRPWVFYPPSEYRDVNPKDFMSALREAPGLSDQIKLAKSVDENPLDLEARFELIDSMADEAQCQWVILMHETGKAVGKWARHVYERRGGGAGSGSFTGITRNSLEGTGIMTSAGGGQYLRLSELGDKFAKWLIAQGRKCDFFWSEYGGWGEPEPGGFAEKSVKEIQDARGLERRGGPATANEAGKV